MLRTRVGYAGGTKPDPTYHDLGDHAETVELEYDPTRISYATLLDVFWAAHDPTARPWSAQYRSLIFYYTPEQQRLAQAGLEREAAARGRTALTELLPARAFYQAEAYHQKYYLRQVPDLLQEFEALYPTLDRLLASTAVARVNGYLAGFANRQEVERELADLGLSPQGQQTLLDNLRP